METYIHASDSRAYEEVVLAFGSLLGLEFSIPKYVYSDNAPEFLKAFRELKFPKGTRQPHRAATTGVERAQRSVKEGLSC